MPSIGNPVEGFGSYRRRPTSRIERCARGSGGDRRSSPFRSDGGDRHHQIPAAPRPASSAAAGLNDRPCSRRGSPATRRCADCGPGAPPRDASVRRYPKPASVTDPSRSTPSSIRVQHRSDRLFRVDRGGHPGRRRRVRRDHPCSCSTLPCSTSSRNLIVLDGTGA